MTHLITLHISLSWLDSFHAGPYHFHYMHPQWKRLLTRLLKSHLALTSSLVSVKYFQRGVHVVIVNLQFHWYASFAVWLQISAVGLDRYSKTILQAAFSMLNMAMCYFIKTRHHQWNHKLTMMTFTLLWEYLTLTRLVVSVGRQDFDTWITRFFQRGVYTEVIRPCMEKVWLWQTIGT